MTELEFWFKTQTISVRKAVRDAVCRNAGISCDSFYKYLGKKMAPALVQKVYCQVTGLQIHQLYRNVTPAQC